MLCDNKHGSYLKFTVASEIPRRRVESWVALSMCENENGGLSCTNYIDRVGAKGQLDFLIHMVPS